MATKPPARNIRAWELEQHRRQRLVIVAVSASVLTGQIIKSIEAGCDQHLSKPVKKEVLLKVLENYRQAQKSPSNPGRAAA